MRRILLPGLVSMSLVTMGLALAADLPRSAAPPDASVYILTPANGEVVSSPLKVVFGLKNMGVAPAGVEREATGHHHLLIDAELPDLDMPIPSDQNHVHFGKGQTETVIELAPGKHTLQLLLGDALHIPHKPPIMSEKIEIIVR